MFGYRIICLFVMAFTCLSVCQTRGLQRGQAELEPEANVLDRTAIASSPILAPTLTIVNAVNAFALTGRVYNANGRPTPGIQRATIHITGCRSQRFQASIKADGRYRLLIPDEALSGCDRVTLQVKAAGYKPFVIQPRVDNLQTQSQRDFALRPIPPTATPSNALEAVALRAMHANFDSLGSSPRFEADESDPTAASYRLSYPSGMVLNFAEIVRYPSKVEAEIAFAAVCAGEYQFHHLRACEVQSNPSYNANSLHYSDSRSIIWLSGRRLYRAVTGYLSTYSGEAGDPAYLAEPLYRSAVDYGLIE